ncbi:tyrosine-type recombinase/integrase [Azospirillum brasilense]|uniref:tyrosine-type recombinase/integrase n=1 Tax=Azospirillum brasilense TaxID=192 RepID=UPI001EDC683A|nr:integrase arm-type DNA-binding domain-containing protein [Azospirillum brasilense]UKJ74238.1 integrase family protein [Azospirillum brasilense]
MGTLTDTMIRRARADGEKRRVLRDGAGLELQITPNGSKTWYVRARVRRKDGGEGVQRRVSLGAYPAVSLADARREAAQIVSAARSGRDPKAVEVRAALGTGKPRTVTEAADCYIDHLKAAGRAESYHTERNRLLGRLFLPAVGSLSIDDVDRAMLSAIVDRETKRQAKAKQKGVQARRLASVVTAMWRFLEDKGWITRRGEADRLLVSVAAEQTRDRTLTDLELGELALALGLLDGKTVYDRENSGLRPPDKGTLDALALALLLGLRGGEITTLRRDDVVEDAETNMTTLRIASRGGKTAAARRDIPLPPLALAIVRRRQQTVRGDLLFPSPSGKTRDGLSVGALGVAAKQLATKLKHRDAEGRYWTPHDLRRTLASILGELDTVEAIQKRILGHAGADVTSRVYDRSKRLKQMQDALRAVEAWVLGRAGKASGAILAVPLDGRR